MLSLSSPSLVPGKNLNVLSFWGLLTCKADNKYFTSWSVCRSEIKLTHICVTDVNSFVQSSELLFIQVTLRWIWLTHQRLVQPAAIFHLLTDSSFQQDAVCLQLCHLDCPCVSPQCSYLVSSVYIYYISDFAGKELIPLSLRFLPLSWDVFPDHCLRSTAVMLCYYFTCFIMDQMPLLILCSYSPLSWNNTV